MTSELTRIRSLLQQCHSTKSATDWMFRCDQTPKICAKETVRFLKLESLSLNWWVSLVLLLVLLNTSQVIFNLQ